LKALFARYPGSLRLGYRDFPLQGLHGQAELAAEASRCAAEQGKFWQYHDALFANPDKLNHNGLLDLARNLKFNEGQFDSCLSSRKYRAEVRRDLQDGIRAGVLGTPGIFINGILVSGAQSEDIFVALIDKELAVTTNSQAHP
jgi:protein-disulfide isomerase